MATDKKNLITPKFRAMFAHVWEPTKTQSGKMMYRITMAFDKATTDITPLRALLREAVIAQWPDKDKRPKALVNPIKDADTDVMQSGDIRGVKYPAMAGCWVMDAMSKFKPQIVDHNVQDILDREQFYSGAYARASVNVFTYMPTKENPSKKHGVGFGLNNLQKISDGDRLGGGSNAKDDFAPVEGTDAPAAAVKPADDDMFE